MTFTRSRHTQRARALRQSSTPAEQTLWQALRHSQLGHKFRRQYPSGGYILDFVCLERGVIVEADGGQHAEQHAYDAARDRHFEAQGFVVLRFWNNEILQNLNGVLERICGALEREGAARPR